MGFSDYDTLRGLAEYLEESLLSLFLATGTKPA
jgi:hypothetical protein